MGDRLIFDARKPLRETCCQKSSEGYCHIGTKPHRSAASARPHAVKTADDRQQVEPTGVVRRIVVTSQCIGNIVQLVASPVRKKAPDDAGAQFAGD
jgi:hypothetical protein